MKIRSVKTGELLDAVIELVEAEDWKIIETHPGFEFIWSKEKDFLVHRIRLAMEDEILGLIALEDVPREIRLHVRLIEVNQKDRGKNRRYDGITGCLFAFGCQLAFQKGYEGFVSLYPKTALIEHYQKAYGFERMGHHLFVELDTAKHLIETYLHHG